MTVELAGEIHVNILLVNESLQSEQDRFYYCFFFKKIGGQVFFLCGHWYLFWTSSNVRTGFQSQGWSLACVLPRPRATDSWFTSGATPADCTKSLLLLWIGVFVWDVEGNRYYDFLSAYSAVNQGHCHPRIIKVLKEQAEVIKCKLTLLSVFIYSTNCNIVSEWSVILSLLLLSLNVCLLFCATLFYGKANPQISLL